MDLNDGGAGGAGGESGAGSAADVLVGGGGAGGERGDGGAGVEAGAGAGGEGGDTGAGGAVVDPDWLASISADAVDGESASLRDWVKAQKTDLNGLAKIARDNQKALRESGRIKLPGEGANEAEVAEFRKAIGVPDDPTGYKLPSVQDANGNDLPMNTAKLEAITAIAHKHGIPAGALEATLQDIAASDAQELAGKEIELSQKADAHAKSWGAERAAKLEAIDQAAGHFNLDKDKLLALRAAWGPEAALDFLAKIGQGMREDTLIGGDKKVRFGGDPVAAQAEIDAMRGDPAIVAKIRVPGTPERIKYDRLQNIVGEAADRAAAKS